jgi:hypothetical protein
VASISRDGWAEERPINVFYELGPINLHGNESDLLLLGAGIFDFLDNETSAAGTVEYRFGRKVFFVGLDLGMMANIDGGFFGYAGIYSDLSYKSFYFTPQLAMGGYHEGSSRDLGGVFQFRQSIDLAYRFDNGHRLGLKVAHISNADIHDTNPGEEELYLTYSLPFGPFL